MLDKFKKITDLQAAIIIVLIGFAVYTIGLKNQFQGDDIYQIVSNIPVHSIKNIRLFFDGGTFYNGNGIAPLTGVYFRPLMTTVFSVLYTLFGAHPFYYHLLQLLLAIGSTFLLYLFFTYSFEPVFALFLALVFLIHPIDSQVVFAIPSMQDVLFMFFGMLSIWFLIRYSSIKSLFLVAVCLLISLFAKESGMLFVAVSLVYLFWWSRKRLYKFMAIIALPIALWLILKIHAIGLDPNPSNSPIDKLSLAHRLLTVPSIIEFYITKFVFPLKLASAYHWTYPTFSFRHVFLPLIVDLIVLGILIYGGYFVKHRARKAMYTSYLFFGIWVGLGLLILLQISPLDMTACEGWFYFPMIGTLGMIGVVADTLLPTVRIDRRLLLLVMVVILIVLGVRTTIRGTNWTDQYTLAYHDIVASPQDYAADIIIANDLDDHHNFQEAKLYLNRSIAIFPDGANYDVLAITEDQLSEFPQSVASDITGLKQEESNVVRKQLFENASRLMVWYGTPAVNEKFIAAGLTAYPQDADLWLNLAVIEYANDQKSAAQTAIVNAYSDGTSSEITAAYSIIMNNQKLTLGPPQPIE